MPWYSKLLLSLHRWLLNFFKKIRKHKLIYDFSPLFDFISILVEEHVSTISSNQSKKKKKKQARLLKIVSAEISFKIQLHVAKSALVYIYKKKKKKHLPYRSQLQNIRFPDLNSLLYKPNKWRISKWQRIYLIYLCIYNMLPFEKLW